MARLLNIILLIAGFSAVGGFVYRVLGLIGFLTVNWIRLIFAIVITLILGLIILKKGKN